MDKQEIEKIISQLNWMDIKRLKELALPEPYYANFTYDYRRKLGSLGLTETRGGGVGDGHTYYYLITELGRQVLNSL